MVNAPQDSAAAAERALALSYAPAPSRTALMTLFDLDARLRRITLAARNPTIGLMRLTWWGEALVALDRARPPAEPLLQALAAEVLPRGVSGAALEGLTDAWARLLEPCPVDLAAYAAERGETLFTASATVLGASHPCVRTVGAGWAAAELIHDRPTEAGAARVLAGASLAGCYEETWPRALRALGAFGLLAQFDATGRTRPGDPRRVGRLFLHRLTGR